MDEKQSSFSDTYSVPTYSSSQKSSKRFVYILIILLLAGAGFGAYKFLGVNLGKQAAAPVTPTPTQEVFPTDTPTPSESPTPTGPVTPTAKPTSSPVDKSSGLDRSDLSVAVQNGSGEVGAASKMAETLKGFGYHVTSTGNADNFSYENVTIQVKSSKNSYLSLLKKDLSATYTVGTTSSDLSASSSADAVVIVGK